MADKEYLYLDHGNTIDLVLKSGGEAQNLSAVTGILAMFDQTSVYSSQASEGPVKWQSTSDTDWELGEIRIDCSSHDIEARRYDVPIIVYDTSNPDGLVWDTVRIEVEDI